MRLLKLLARLDVWLAWSRPGWLWLGQLAVVILGVHLAADRLDDLLAEQLATIAVAWPSPESPLTAATWVAVVAELAMVVWAGWALWRAREREAGSPADWWSRASLHSLTAPIVWLVLASTGLWVVTMAVEDALTPTLLSYATPVAWMATGAVAWRLVAPALVRLVRQTPRPASRVEGLLWTPLLLVVCVLAAKHGLPVWGWFA